MNADTCNSVDQSQRVMLSDASQIRRLNTYRIIPLSDIPAKAKLYGQGTDRSGFKLLSKITWYYLGQIVF